MARTGKSERLFSKIQSRSAAHPITFIFPSVTPSSVMPSPNPDFKNARDDPHSEVRSLDPLSVDPERGLDFIGDLHGHAGRLDDLLDRLDYQWVDGIPRHRDRTAIFLGDYVDRGPEIRRTLETVRSMVDRGDAIALMGNHEYNAIAWFTPRPDRPEEPCRRHTPIRQDLIAPTLASLGEDTPAWIDWMRSLPLWFETERVRAVHATWDRPSIEFLREMLAPTNGALTEPLMQATCEPRSSSFRAIEQVLKGREIPLPDGVVLTDPEGSPRRHIRARWFESPHGRTYREHAFTRDDSFPDIAIPPDAIAPDSKHYAPTEPPVFVGHYWMQGTTPTRLAPNVACLDWSVARGGPLVAYRFDGESEIDNARFVAV